MNKPRDVASGQNPLMHLVAETSDRKFRLFLTRLTYLPTPHPFSASLSSTTLYHANRSPPPSPPLPPPLDIHLHEGEIVVDDRREISSPPRVEGLLARSLPARVRKHARSRSGERKWGYRAERGKRHLLPPALPRVSLRGGLTPCVGATRIPSGSEERRTRWQEEEGEGRGKREREREEWGHWGGVKRLTVCYHGNATPLRQEERLNPARYGPCSLSLSLSFSQYTPSTVLSRVPTKEQRGDDEGVRP